MIHDHCVACGTVDNLNQHHLVPRSIGGSDDDSNLLTLCGSCHAKAHQVQADWRHSELTKTAMQAKKQRGELVGAVPYGYRCDNGVDLIKDEYEQKAISLILNFNNEGLSLRKIAAELSLRGLDSRKGTWHPATIRKIVAAS